MMRKTLLLAITLILVSCGTSKLPKPEIPGEGSWFRRFTSAIFTHASMADLQFEGSVDNVRDGSLETLKSLTSALPETSRALRTIEAFVSAGLIERRGIQLVDVKLKDEDEARTFICRPNMAKECALLKKNQGVRLYTKPTALEGAFILTRIVTTN
jgi:hypothetical protein